MRPAHINVGATGPSGWVPLDYLEAGFGVGYLCTVQQGASLTYKVQHGFLLGEPISLANLTRSTTTATATWRVGADTNAADYSASHGMSNSDCVLMSGYGAPFDGVYTITSSSGTVFTYTVANSGATASRTGYCQRITVIDDPTVTGATASAEGNIGFPPWAIRLNATIWASGVVSMAVMQGIST